ncbi:MAG TPA: response regulator transcription factor [Trebonia sp.]|nr:response regulator transcription factor [Trebonia sp.]HUN36588.1 response regulator transcription factor [Trebonia sp.]
MTDEQAGGEIRIVVADDQRSVLDGLALMLGLLPDITVVAVAADGAETLAAVGRHHPDVVVLDLHMPGMDGIEATRRLSAEHPGTAVVVLTTYSDDMSILGALRAGARGYLTKNAGRADIARAIHAAARGQSILDAAVQATVLEVAASSPARPAPSPELPDGLTSREGDVLMLVAQGLSNSDIAAALFLSANTVKTHINRVFTKTGSKTRAQAIRYAYDHGLTGG